MRILFNATSALPGTSGFAHTVGLLSQLSSLAPQHDFILLTTPEQQSLRDRLGRSVIHHIVNNIRGGGLARTMRLQLSMGPIVRRLGVDLIYNKGNFYSVGAGAQVCFIENSNPFSTLRLREPLWYRTRNQLLRVMSDHALKHAAAVIFPTQHARRLITMRSDTRAPTFVVPYGWELPESHSVAAPERPYLLCVSSILPYKNLSLVIEAFHELRKRGRFDGDLVIVGVSGVAGGGYYHHVIQRRIEDLGLVGYVRVTPPVAADQLAMMYLSAACLLMPSLEESFGIPLIEAMGVGTPVVAARVAEEDADQYFIPFEEICGDAAEYFDPFDARSCSAATERALVPLRRIELIEAGRRRAAFYSWRSAGEQTLKVLEAVA